MLANFLNTRQTFVWQHCWQTHVGQHLFVVCPRLYMSWVSNTSQVSTWYQITRYDGISDVTNVAQRVLQQI